MTLPTERRNTPSAVRSFVFSAAVVLGFAVVAVRLHTVQIVQGEEFAKKSLENFVQTKRLVHDRGEIFDRDGRVLVSTRSAYDVTVTPVFLPDTRRTVEKLAKAAGLSRAEGAAVAAAFRRSLEEDGPPILMARALDGAHVESVRAFAVSLDVPILALPVIADEEDDGPRYAIYLDPKEFPSSTRVMEEIARILDLTPAEKRAVLGRLARTTGLERYRDLIIRRDLDRAVAERITARVELGVLPGITVRASRARQYHYARVGAHLLGFVNELSPEELEERRELGYRLGDHVGRRGVEKAYEEVLRGVDGYESVVVDSKGRPQESGFAEALREAAGVRELPRAGSRVVLALDIDVQESAERAFLGRAGSVVVLEVDTGRILALTSTPSFDPNLVSGTFDRAERRRLHELSSLRPWRFRAIQDHFAPGSTFKVVTLLAALAEKATTMTEVIGCRGAFQLGDTRFRCWHDGHGGVNIYDSLARSCDVYYYTMGNRLGLDPIAEMGLALGFGERTGINIAGEGKGIMPTEAWYKKHTGIYTRGAAVNVSIGQGAVAVTPIQLAVAYAAIANGGKVWEPQVALRIEAEDGAVQRFEPKLLRDLHLDERHRAAVMEGLIRVVNHPTGTAKKVKLEELVVAGKTGTAQVAKMGAKRVSSKDLPYPLRDHAWFAAVAPAADPKIAVVVFNEHGGGGSSAAAPTAMAVIKTWHDKRATRAGLPPGPVEVGVLP